MKLYQITHQIIDAQNQRVDETQLDKLEIDFRQKAVACAGVIKNFDSWVESIDNEIKRLKERKQVTLNKKERLKITCYKRYRKRVFNVSRKVPIGYQFDVPLSRWK